MKIEQFYDQDLSHASYAIISNGEIAVIDPARDCKPYLDFAKQNNAFIKAVIETHPHADFVSSHLEISQVTGAPIYVSKLVGAEYQHIPFDEGSKIKVGKIHLKAINTPGHSPDSISILLLDEQGQEAALFTGDTLFIGDVGRPDLRENTGNIQMTREKLAAQMYHSTRNKIMTLPDSVLVYPAHGAGSLCGKALSDKLVSNIGEEKANNYALQTMTEKDFIKLLLEDQPFIPKYFPHDVMINKSGAEHLEKSIKGIYFVNDYSLPDKVLNIDIRSEKDFKKSHRKGAINIQLNGKFETWLGSIISPTEHFYITGANDTELSEAIYRAAKIGYEKNIEGKIIYKQNNHSASSSVLDLEDFKSNTDHYQILDIRNTGERNIHTPFKKSIHIELASLRENIDQIPDNKPLVVHCAGGYRSAVGSSILENQLNIPVYDLSEHVKQFN